MSAVATSFADRPVSPGNAGWVTCTFEGVTLMVPQIESPTRALASGLVAATSPGYASGWFVWHENRWPVYTLNRELEPLQARVPDRAWAVLIANRERAIGLLCEHFQSIEATTTVRMHEVPARLHHPASPIRRLALYNGIRVAFLTSAELLLRHIDAQLSGQ